MSREEYFELFGVIGTKYGAGDGSTTFNLPNETDGRFREGGSEVGTKKEAGLPNITGKQSPIDDENYEFKGAFYLMESSHGSDFNSNNQASARNALGFDASRSNPIYGNSDTVQPKSITYLPIIRAF